VALTAPVPRPPRRLRERDDRWMTLSRHPESSPIRDRFTPVPFDWLASFRTTRLPTFHRRPSPRARPPFTPAATLFGALRVSLFEARCHLPTSATAITTCGHCTRALQSSQGRRPRPPSFSDASRGLFLGGGDTRRAAHRPLVPTSVPVPSRFRRICPTAIPTGARHLRRLAPVE